MSARKPRNLAEALATSPTMRITLEPGFVVELAAMEHIGVDDWAAWMVQRAQLANIGKSAACVELRLDTGACLERFYLHRPAECRKLATAYRKRARWALKLGLSAAQALAYVPEADREATARLMAEECATARLAVDAWNRAAAERDKAAAA